LFLSRYNKIFNCFAQLGYNISQVPGQDMTYFINVWWRLDCWGISAGAARRQTRSWAVRAKLLQEFIPYCRRVCVFTK